MCKHCSKEHHKRWILHVCETFEIDINLICMKDLIFSGISSGDENLLYTEIYFIAMIWKYFDIAKFIFKDRRLESGKLLDARKELNRREVQILCKICMK